MNVRPLDLEEQTSFLVQIKETMATLTAPLQSQLAQVNQEIEQTQAKLDELRKARSLVTNTLRSIDPDLAPPVHGPKKNGTKKTKSKPSPSDNTGIGEEKLGALTTWLQEHRDEINAGDGFSARSLLDEYPELEEIGARTSIAKALSHLHETGLLNLDSWLQGRARSDGSKYPGKYFKVA